MNGQFFAALLAAAVTVIPTGCSQKAGADGQHASSEAVELGVTYSAKSGLLVPEETAKFIGLETVEVSERPIHAVQEITARIFRAATKNVPHGLASALVSTADAAVLEPGSSSMVTPPSPRAELLSFDRSGETQTGMVEAILRVDDAALALAQDSFVTVRFPIGSTNAVTVVPNSALFRTTAGDFVYLENGAHFVRATVKPGRTDGKFTEVTEGLLAGDKVVVQPVMTLWMTELHNVNGGDACCVKPEAKK